MVCTLSSLAVDRAAACANHGTVFALLRRVLQTTAGAVVVANVAMSSAGCLLDRSVRAADASIYLLPLSAPVFVEERTLGIPAPGDIVLLRAPMGGESVSQRFEIKVLYDASANLQVRVWRDRDRPCDPMPSGQAPSTCGTVITPSSGAVLRRTGVELERKIVFNVDLNVPGGCSRIDLYVSPQFRDDPGQEHLPVRPGEVAHARWFVAVEQSNREPPSVKLCNDRSAEGVR
jgi:hypothetical protein